MERRQRDDRPHIPRSRPVIARVCASRERARERTREEVFPRECWYGCKENSYVTHSTTYFVRNRRTRSGAQRGGARRVHVAREGVASLSRFATEERKKETRDGEERKKIMSDGRGRRGGASGSVGGRSLRSISLTYLLCGEVGCFLLLTGAQHAEPTATALKWGLKKSSVLSSHNKISQK